MATEPVTQPRSITPILAAVKTVLRGQAAVSLPEQGIDVLFDSGVVARCRVCRLTWEVKRSRFALLTWWACPSGCRH